MHQNWLELEACTAYKYIQQAKGLVLNDGVGSYVLTGDFLCKFLKLVLGLFKYVPNWGQDRINQVSIYSQK